MKLFDNCFSEALNSALNFETGLCKIIGRVEIYSCKLVTEEKRLYKRLNVDQWKDELQDDSTINRKTLFYLIATLNASFGPDYEFSKAQAEEFSRELNHVWVMNATDANFQSSPAHQSYSALKPQLWQSLDNAINMTECEIYSYNPDLTSDPYSEDGCLWSFNYFFYNKKLKRVLFFTCCATSNSVADSSYNNIDYQDIAAMTLSIQSPTINFKEALIDSSG